MTNTRDFSAQEAQAKKIVQDLQTLIITSAKNKEFTKNTTIINYYQDKNDPEKLTVTHELKKVLDIIEATYRKEISFTEALVRIKEITHPYAIKVEKKKPKTRNISPSTLHVYIKNKPAKNPVNNINNLDEQQRNKLVAELDALIIGCHAKIGEQVIECELTKALKFDFSELGFDNTRHDSDIDKIKSKILDPKKNGILSVREKIIIQHAMKKSGFENAASEFLTNYFQDTQEKLVFIGDSTIDNKIWVEDGRYLNALRELLGIKPAKLSQKIHNQAELSVVENIRTLLPQMLIADHTNDGFTTRDCLKGGQRNAVFGSSLPISFPSETFEPLVDGAQDIKKANYIVLSVGGNNIREFLKNIHTFDKGELKTEFANVLETLKTEYVEIINEIRRLNSDAKIILMTQYYPSATQNNYKIYPSMQKIGPLFDLGLNPNNPMDVIHALIQETYTNVLSTVKDENIVVADITSSLDPFDSKNNVGQIEPSGIGGRKIALMLKHIIEDTKASQCVFRFLPAFFTKSDTEEPQVENLSLKNWSPKHPHEFTKKANYDPREAIRSIQATLLDPNATLSDQEQQAIASNHMLRNALIVLQQIDPTFATYNNFKAIENNISLQQTLYAAHGYLNSGNFGLLKTHGKHGRDETKVFVRSIIADASETNLQQSMARWLKTSNTHHSSRAYYAAACGLFGNNKKREYLSGNKRDREEILTSMRASQPKK